MVDGTELRAKRGTFTVLALLVSFLLGYAPAAAQTEADSRSARLGSTELVKRGTALRTTIRGQSEDGDQETALLSLPPSVVTIGLGVRPATSITDAGQAAPIPGRLHAYRARAPPAA